jgi:hypothetical protein
VEAVGGMRKFNFLGDFWWKEELLPGERTGARGKRGVWWKGDMLLKKKEWEPYEIGGWNEELFKEKEQ